MLELRIVKDGTALPVFDLPSALGRRGAAKEIGDQIDALICLLDDLGGDPDLEDGGDDEPTGDETDASFPEWHPAFPRALRMEARMSARLYREDDEEDDHSGGVGAEDDFDRPHYLTPVRGPGCALSDEPEYSEGDADVDDRPIADPDAYRFHLSRIRDQRCDRRPDPWRPGASTYKLKGEGGLPVVPGRWRRL